MSIRQFIAMGGYGDFVWSAYGFAMAVLILNVIQPLRRRRRVLRALKRAAAVKSRHEKTA